MKILLVLLMNVLLPALAYSHTVTDSLLTVLKNEITNKNIYDKAKETRINQLRKQLHQTAVNDLNRQYHLSNKLYLEYKDYLFDSAHVYTTKLIDISNRIPDMAKQYDSRIKLATIQLSWGMFKETFDGIYQMDSKKMPDSLKIKYYELKSIAYGRLALYNTDENYNADHKAASLKALDSVVLLSKPGSYERHFYAAAYYKRLGRDEKAEAHYRALLNMDKLTQHQKAMVAHDLSHITDDNEKRNLITVSAIADIRSSTKETLAIFTLGKMLFEQGNLADAEILIKEALSQASFYGNKLRVMEASTALNAVLAEKLIFPAL